MHEECYGITAIDQAVVVREGHVHHRTDDDLAFASDGAILDRVHAEDAALRWVHDRCGEQRAEGAAVGDRECAAFKVGGVKLVG